MKTRSNFIIVFLVFLMNISQSQDSIAWRYFIVQDNTIDFYRSYSPLMVYRPSFSNAVGLTVNYSLFQIQPTLGVLLSRVQINHVSPFPSRNFPKDSIFDLYYDNSIEGFNNKKLHTVRLNISVIQGFEAKIKKARIGGGAIFQLSFHSTSTYEKTVVKHYQDYDKTDIVFDTLFNTKPRFNLLSFYFKYCYSVNPRVQLNIDFRQSFVDLFFNSTITQTRTDWPDFFLPRHYISMGFGIQYRIFQSKSKFTTKNSLSRL